MCNENVSTCSQFYEFAGRKENFVQTASWGLIGVLITSFATLSLFVTLEHRPRKRTVFAFHCNPIYERDRHVLLNTISRIDLRIPIENA